MTRDNRTSEEELIMEAKSFFTSQKKEIGLNTKTGEKVVRIKFEDLSEYSPELAERAIFKPEETIRILENALHETGMVPDAIVKLGTLPASQNLRIRNIRAKNFNMLISISGLIIHVGKIRHRVCNVRFECPACGTISSILQKDKKVREPIRCSCGRRDGFKKIDQNFDDYFQITIQEQDSKEQLEINLEGVFLDSAYSNIIREGNLVGIIGVLKNKEEYKESENDFELSPIMGINLIEEKKSKSNIDEFIEHLRAKKNLGAYAFEDLIGDIFKKKGYKVKVTRRSGDFGIDVIAEREKEKVAIQCKLFDKDSKISNSYLQKVMGSSISPYEGTKIIFITTAGDFTAPAIEQIKTSKVPIELWDRKRLIAEIQTINYDLDEGWAILNELEAKEMGYSDTQSLDITSFDIDRISGNPASKRNKIYVMKEILEELETRLGKLIPIEEIEKSVGDKLKPDEIEETLEKLVRAGDLFRPRKGYVQIMDAISF